MSPLPCVWKEGAVSEPHGHAQSVPTGTGSKGGKAPRHTKFPSVWYNMKHGRTRKHARARTPPPFHIWLELQLRAPLSHLRNKAEVSENPKKRLLSREAFKPNEKTESALTHCKKHQVIQERKLVKYVNYPSHNYN